MLNLMLIIVLLFAALALIVTFLEKRGTNISDERLQRMSRWFVPLVALALVLQGIRYLMG